MQVKKSLKTNLSPLITNLTYSENVIPKISKRISILQYMKANILAVILVNTFDVSSSMVVKRR